jgi:ankyrin repeat protein
LAPKASLYENLDDTLVIAVGLRRFEFLLALLIVCNKPSSQQLEKYNVALCEACRKKTDLPMRNPVFPRYYLGLKKETLDSLQTPPDIYYQKTIVEMLLQHGVPVEVKRSEWSPYTPLFWAIFSNRLPLAHTLLHRHGADPLFATKEGETGLSIAVYHNNHRALALLLRLEPDTCMKLTRMRNFLNETPLHQAASKGNARIIRLLLDRQPAMRERQFMNQNVLHLSADMANKRGFEILLDHIQKESPDQLREMLQEKDTSGGESPHTSHVLPV